MPRNWVLRLAIGLGLTILVFVGAMRDRPEFGVAALAFALYTLLSLRVGRAGRPLVALAIGLSALLVASSRDLASATVAAVPLIANALLCYAFGATLLPGREPLITRYCRYDLGYLPTEFVLYTRHWTAFWTALLAAFTVECALLMWFCSTEVYSYFANFVNNAIVAAFFLGEHLLRTALFPEFGWASPLRTGRAILLASSEND